MGYATGLLLAEKLSSLEDHEISLSWLQYHVSDGPNVSKTVCNKLDEQISALPERKGKDLVNIWTCNLCICLNGAISFYVWFKLSAFRREDYDQVMLNQSGSLWLQFNCKLSNSLMVLNSISSLMPLRNSFPCCIIKHTKRSVIKSNKFILAEIHFVAANADIFNQFLVLFQKDKVFILCH